MSGFNSEASPCARDSRGDEGCLYILTHPNFPDKVKIGRSADPADRLRTYQCGCPIAGYAMPFILRTSNAHKAERLAHKLLEEYRLEGEWFGVSLEKARNVAAHACAVQEGSLGIPSLVADLTTAAEDRRFLLKRGRGWFVRVVLPRRLWPVVGKREMVRTLRTADFAEAIERRSGVLRDIRAEVARMEAAARPDAGSIPPHVSPSAPRGTPSGPH